jgi:curved DNA-binding protein CbpA
MGELENAYRMLELEPGASMDEINQAYKDLVFIWHPDRLPNENLRLQEKAQEKIKHLNKARDYLRSQAKVGNPAVRARSSDRRASQAYTSARAYSTYHRPRTTTAATEARSDRSEERPSGQSSYYRSRQYYRPDPSQYQSYNNSRSYGNNSAASSTTNGTGAANGTGNGTASDRYRSASTSRAAAPSSPSDGSNYYRDTWSGGYPGQGFSSRPSNGQTTSTNQPPPSTPSRARKQDPDLSGSDLRGANLQEKDFSGRNLSNCNLCEANLQDAFLHKVNLNRANLSKANLFRANLLQANLSHANLREANLIGADLSGADLSGADLSGSKVAVGDKVMVKLTGTVLTGAIMPDGTIYT